MRKRNYVIKIKMREHIVIFRLADNLDILPRLDPVDRGGPLDDLVDHIRVERIDAGQCPGVRRCARTDGFDEDSTIGQLHDGAPVDHLGGWQGL